MPHSKLSKASSVTLAQANLIADQLDRPGQGQLQFTSNRLDVQLVRHENVDGVDYLVAPAVLFKAGVFNGELILAQELGNHFHAWNGQPVVIGHPKEKGEHTSANDPETLARRKAGQLFNVSFDANVLRGEIWIDPKKARRIDGGEEVLERLENEQPLDVSTAYFRDLEKVPGVFGDAEYNGIARNLHPDHLAILLNERGACSWEHGCGVPRVNKSTGNTGAMVAFYLPSDIAGQLAQKNGLDSDDLHLTLAFLGEAVDVSREALLKAVSEFAKEQKPVTGDINGVGCFANAEEDGKRALYVNFDSPTLPDFRAALVGNLKQAGVAVVENHGFTPHITLAYVDNASRLPDVGLIEEVQFDEISAVIGDEVFDFPLGGVMQTNVEKKARRPSFDGIEETSWEDVDKTWEAYRAGFYKHTATEPLAELPTRVQDAPQSMKDWIASKSLLGDPQAEDFDNLLFFPVVNPGTDMLNAGAVRAVLGGRAAQADIPAAALESAQEMARGLLDKIKSEEQVENTRNIWEVLQALARKLGILPEEDSTSEASEITEVNVEREQVIAAILEDGRLLLTAEQLAELTDDVLAALYSSLEGMVAEEPPEEPVAESQGTVAPATEEPAANQTNCLPDSLLKLAEALDKRGGVERTLELLDGLQANEKQEKSELVAELSANAQCAFNEDQLKQMSVEQLGLLAQSLRPGDYSGRGGGPQPVSRGKAKQLGMPYKRMEVN